MQLAHNVNERSQFVKFCARIAQEVAETGGMLSSEALRRLRRELTIYKYHPYSLEEIKSQLANSVVLDLVAQSWQLKVSNSRVQIHVPMQQDNSPIIEKERVRRDRKSVV